MNYHGNAKAKHYSYAELLTHVSDVKKKFPTAVGGIKRGQVELTLFLKPTENSIEYTVKLYAKQGSKNVKLFVVKPQIKCYTNGKKVPHLYCDGSLCLHYPSYNEWSYGDSWAATLIPWASLWLFYYEIWVETNQWLGGGIHGKKVIPPV